MRECGSNLTGTRSAPLLSPSGPAGSHYVMVIKLIYEKGMGAMMRESLEDTIPKQV